MPRSYSFDHFTATQKSVSRSAQRKAKQQYLESELESAAPASEGGVHYGHRFAETQEKLHERQANPPQPPTVKAELPKVEVPPSTAPIGSVPLERTQEEEDGSFRAVWEDAQHAARTLVNAARDAGRASFRLARLPWDLVQVTAHGVRRLRQRILP